MSRAGRSIVLSLISALALARWATCASLYDPIYRFRTISTEHFVIYFHQGEDRLAARLAVIAEDTWRGLRVPLGTLPPALTHVVIADQTELANGSATPVPYNTIVITAAWPAGSDFIGRTDDWLRLVFTHEFTHIIHLDRSEGWARFVRGVFGRVPVAFPNLFLPVWSVEGLAVYEESARTGEGRLHAGDFKEILDAAARGGGLEPLDRVNGGLTDWPGGLAAYAYGAGFHAYLAERFGEEKFGRVAEATAGRLPFTFPAIFRREFGQSLGSLWKDYETSLTNASSQATGAAASTVPEATTDASVRRLTHHGFLVTGPRFDARCPNCSANIVYSARGPNEFPAMYRLAAGESTPAKLASRYFGSTSASGLMSIYFDQYEFTRNAGLYSDLYRFDRKNGRVTRLTVGARLLDPDLSPDETTLVCVREAAGRRELVLVDVSVTPLKVTPLISEPDGQFNAPRWSPRGERIVAERHVPGRLSEIVVVDVVTRAVHPVASDSTARLVTPTWRPDGGAVVAAWDRDENVFDLYEFIVSDADPHPSARRLTRVAGGAMWPDISADQRSILFVGYTADGFDVFEALYSPTPAPIQSRQPDSPPHAVEPLPTVSGQDAAAATYNPWRTLRPTSWSPIVTSDPNQLRVGLTTGGADVLAYHAYSVSATWLIASPSAAPTPTAAEPDWQAYYQYARWRPTFFLSASSDTSFFAGPADERGVPTAATLREREIQGGMLFPIRRARVNQAALTTLVRDVGEFTLADGIVSRRRTSLRAGWALDSSRLYGYSISPEDGVSIGATAELTREALGSSGNANTITADARMFVSPFRNHQVLAVRLAAGTSSGDAAVRQTFHLGGAASNPGTLDFGRNALSLMRGFGSDTFAGRRVALLNAEYRWPLGRPQRGHGTWPLFLHTVHAAAFADVGHAWDRAFVTRDLKTSFGGEMSLDVVAGYFTRFTLTAGAAWGRDGSHTIPSGSSVYFRVGRAF